MGKLMLFICVALLVGGVMSASSGRRWTPPPKQVGCGSHGDPCSTVGGCCSGTTCHRYAGRCQATITAEQLNAQREKILGRRGPDQ